MELIQLPPLQSAVRQGEDGQLGLVHDALLPTLPPGYALVKVSHVALNPLDYKLAKNFPLAGAFVGADFAGTVVAMADDVDPGTLRLGEVVWGAVFCFSAEHRLATGAFSQYARTRADLLMRVPSRPLLEPKPSPMGPLQAATLPTAVCTNIIALWAKDALGLQGTPDSPLDGESSTPVLVYGGSTATGTIALQLLKLSGYEPIATCSPHNFDLVRRRGASTVLDYSLPDLPERIKAHAGGRLKYVLDCISDANSATICYSAIQRPGGRYVSLNVIPQEILDSRRAVASLFVLASEICNEEVKLGHPNYDRPANEEKHKVALWGLRIVQRLLDRGLLVPHPAEVVPGGLGGVIEGLDTLASGVISGKKLVVCVE